VAKLIRLILKYVATLGPVGYIPVAPGTFGSLAALLLVALLRPSAEAHGALTAFFAVLGTAASHSASRSFGGEDPGQIVIDEFTGFLLATVYLPQGAFYFFSSFILFRFFDILKPPPIGWLERVGGGPGIMADDIAAGIAANLILQLWRLLI
jgi:phosphatidylglycerophosphatase A